MMYTQKSPYIEMNQNCISLLLLQSPFSYLSIIKPDVPKKKETH